MIGPLKKIFGTKNDRDLKLLKPLIQKINGLEASMKQLSDEELKAQTPKLRKYLEDGKTLTDILPEAFATIREASTRVLGMRHYDVQLMGGIVLFEGKIAEMKTGEGKTLTATLPLYLMGLSGKGAHCITVNDYLASRDAKEMGELYAWMGLTCGCIVNEMGDEERKEAYRCDITYGTNNEFAFDYLRDNMKFDLSDYVQREFHYCIVDEVDSILIDEARTPLLISGPSEGDSTLYQVANTVIPKLSVEKHFTVDEKSRSAILTEDGVSEIQSIVNIENLYDIAHSELLHHLNQALRAHHLFKKDVDYVVKDGQVIIVDEFTGRLKTGSRWSDGLHQAVEAKEGVQIKKENQTLASITFQNYFRMYERLAGMTGTADTEAEEFSKIYSLDVVVVPTNLPMVRKDMADVIYKNRAAKLRAIVNLIDELHQKKQPVLVGTISIDSSEWVSNELKKRGIPHHVLNAKQHENEATIVADAGQPGAVTIATNMAGRGTDIKLGPGVKELGGLFILGTERHESRRIDNQLRGRSGRQGDPGASKFFLSLEDDLMRIFGSDRISKFMHTLGMEEDEPIEHKMISNAIAKAQQKVETHNFEIRKHLLEYDNVMNEQRRVIYRLRREILGDQENVEFIKEMIEDVAHEIVDNHRPEKKVPLEAWPWEALQNGYKTAYNLDHQVSALQCSNEYDGEIAKYFGDLAVKALDEKFSQYDPEQVKLAVREILLNVFDNHWKGHLLAMDHLKEGINLKAYGQRDPLTEYKREAFSLFENMRATVKRAIVQNIFTVRLYTEEEIEEIRRRQQQLLEAQLEAAKRAQEAAEAAQSHGTLAGPSERVEMEPEQERPALRRSTAKVGRNDPCPCGSGKKYKHCHGV